MSHSDMIRKQYPKFVSKCSSKPFGSLKLIGPEHIASIEFVTEFLVELVRELGRMVHWTNNFWTVGPQLTEYVFEGGKRKAQLDYQRDISPRVVWR